MLATVRDYLAMFERNTNLQARQPGGRQPAASCTLPLCSRTNGTLHSCAATAPPCYPLQDFNVFSTWRDAESAIALAKGSLFKILVRARALLPPCGRCTLSL